MKFGTGIGTGSKTLKRTDEVTESHVQSWSGQLNKASLFDRNPGTYGGPELSTPSRPNIPDKVYKPKGFYGLPPLQTRLVGALNTSRANSVETDYCGPHRVEPMREPAFRPTRCQACKCM